MVLSAGAGGRWELALAGDFGSDHPQHNAFVAGAPHLVSLDGCTHDTDGGGSRRRWGLSTAQELAERGFEVGVHEARKEFGGKARSIPAPDSASEGRKPLPGEHGFRFFPGFYRYSSTP